MKLTLRTCSGGITLLLCALFWAASLVPAEAKPVPTSVQYWGYPGHERGTLISLHGGGWVGDRDLASIRRKMRPFVQPALAAGWSVAHVAYSSGAAEALADIHRVYKKVRRKHGDSLPVCLLGNSAGGHLALTYAGMAARKRRASPVSCVIASSPPTDIAAFRRQAASKPPARRRHLYRFLDIGFENRRQIFRLSPVRFASRYESKTLLFAVQGDPVVDPTQAVAFSAKLERHRPNLFNRTIVLRAGELPFVHRGISAAGWSIYREQVRNILRLA